MTGKQAGGGQYAQRLVALRNYDLERAKEMARRTVGMGGLTAATPSIGST